MVDFDEDIDGDKISIQQQLFKIDVLLYFEKSGKTIIVEDKVYSSEHGEQIERYRSHLLSQSPQMLEEYSIPKMTQEMLYTVYFKTFFL